MPDDESGILEHSKVVVARRQLTEAIRLFFEQRDPVAIHTLTCAAQEVLHALAKARSIKGSVILDFNWIREDRRAEIVKLLKKPQNYFKHADRDSSDVLEFRPKVTAFYIYDTIGIWRSLSEPLFFEAGYFCMWFAAKYPDILDHDITLPGASHSFKVGEKIPPEPFSNWGEILANMYSDKTFMQTQNLQEEIRR